jgi:hypothetical protein
LPRLSNRGFQLGRRQDGCDEWFLKCAGGDGAGLGLNEGPLCGIGVGRPKESQSESGNARGKSEQDDGHAISAKQGKLTAVKLQCSRKQCRGGMFDLPTFLPTTRRRPQLAKSKTPC